jgi:hypothetical protein
LLELDSAQVVLRRWDWVLELLVLLAQAVLESCYPELLRLSSARPEPVPHSRHPLLTRQPSWRHNRLPLERPRISHLPRLQWHPALESSCQELLRRKPRLLVVLAVVDSLRLPATGYKQIQARRPWGQ